MKSIVLSPHDDDNCLFAAFTCMREKPTVVVCLDSHIQPNRGEIGCSADERARETDKACAILGCDVMRLHINDDALLEDMEDVLMVAFRILRKMIGFEDIERVYAPALQGGNAHHDLVHKVAHQFYGDIVRDYTTYTKTELWTKGLHEVVPTLEEKARKHAALLCYESQLRLPATGPHFEAVLGKSEWLNY